MSHSGISLITPLSEANNVRSYGGKAVRLAHLPSGSYMIPRGFVISADMYRMHLWQCGYKNSDSSISPEDLQQLILETPLAQESIDSITDFYHTLGIQVGYQNPQVMVRPSVVEPESNVKLERRLYEHRGPVSSIDELIEAVKIVWASLWSPNALAYHQQIEGMHDPAMAVVVQDFIRCSLTGNVRTADVISGTFGISRLLYYNPETEGNRYTAVFKLESMEFVDNKCDDATLNVLSTAVDKSIMLESVLGECVYMEWGWDGKWLWIFQCDPLRPVPTVHIDPDAEFDRPYNLVSESPLPEMCIPQPVRNDIYPYRLLASAGIDNDTYIADGYLYRPVVGRSAPEKFLNAVMSATPKVREYADSDVYSPNAAKLSEKILGYEIEDGYANLRLLQGWMSAATVASYFLRDQLSEILQSVDCLQLLPDLLGGIDCPFKMRDARIQDFGLRLMEAQQSGQSENREWWEAFRWEVENFADEYIYSFTSPVEYYDISAWESWKDDISQVFRLIKAAAIPSNKPGIPVLHTAAVEKYAKALESISKSLPASEIKRFKQLLEAARQWILARYQLEHKLAFTASIQRNMLKEVWTRIAGSENISAWRDIFELDTNSLQNILQAESCNRYPIAKNAISKSRHRRWLRSRLKAPSIIGLEPDQVPDTQEHTRQPMMCSEGIFGQVKANLQPVLTYNDASEMDASNVVLLNYPALSWSPAVWCCSGIVSEHLPEVPKEAIVYTEYGIPAVYGCPNAYKKLKSCKKIILDAAERLITRL